MSTAEILAALTPEFDSPVMPRPEFGAVLWSRIQSELNSPLVDGPSIDRAPRRPRRSTLAWLVRSPRRVALAVVIVLLVLSAVAMATYFGVRTWVSSSPRGVQTTSDFTLSRVVAPSPRLRWFWSTALSADGHDLYFVAYDGQVYRVRGVDSERPSPPALFLNPAAVRDPAFSDGERLWQALATAPGGDVFVIGEERTGPLVASVMVVRPDGTRGTVVTYDELRKRGLLPGTVKGPDGRKQQVEPEDASFSIAAVAADRVWLLARVSRHAQAHIDASPYDLRYFLIEVVDPNRDGNWSDRIFHRLTLPRSVPGFEGADTRGWWYDGLVVEPPLPDGGQPSVLLPSSQLGKQTTGSKAATFRVFRLSDRNGDGDLLDAGETTVAYRAQTPAKVAARTDRSSGRPVSELVLRGGTRSDRISLVSDQGKLTDLGRSFSDWGTIVAGESGDIYAIEEVDAGGHQMDEVLRLSASKSSLSAAPELRQAAIHVPHATPATLLVTTVTAGSLQRSTFWLRTDGSALPFADRNVADLCGSTDGRYVAFTSDATVPREPFVYLAATDSRTTPAQVTTTPATPACPFDGRHLVLATSASLGSIPTWTLQTYNLNTRHLQPFARLTPQFAVSPDGTRVAYVDRSARGDSLVVIDLATMKRERIVDPTTAREIPPATYYSVPDGLAWSPDGRSVAFVAGPPFTNRELAAFDGFSLPPHRYSVSIASIAGHRIRTAIPLLGGPPTIKWSPDGRQLLVCSLARPPYTGCQGSTYGADPSTLYLVNAAGPSRVRIVASGTIDFADWNPTGRGYAWASNLAIHLSNGRTIEADSVSGDWAGWSPDGRYIAMDAEDGLTLVDIASGKRRTLLSQDVGNQTGAARWWP